MRKAIVSAQESTLPRFQVQSKSDLYIVYIIVYIVSTWILCIHRHTCIVYLRSFMICKHALLNAKALGRHMIAARRVLQPRGRRAVRDVVAHGPRGDAARREAIEVRRVGDHVPWAAAEARAPRFAVLERLRVRRHLRAKRDSKSLWTSILRLSTSIRNF